MAGSSELSNALNPNYYLTRTTNEPSNFPGGNTIGQPSYSQPGQHYAGPSNPYMTGPSVGHSQPIQAHAHIPHRSELADAINPDHVARPVAPNVVPLQQSQTQHDPMVFLKNLAFRLTHHVNKSIAEQERRRLAWQKEQEAKHFEQQNILESRLYQIQQEIETLKAIVYTQSESHSPEPDQEYEMSDSPESSNLVEEPPEIAPESDVIRESQKRVRSGSPLNEPEAKTRARNDGRPQTIQAAMRLHILRCMNIEYDRDLPPSHIEGDALADSDPVRFVWEQTTKKSGHNARMKNRIVEDIIANKELYSLVSAHEFTKLKLESVFDQSFTTLRQKYTIQTGRDDREARARRARKMNRKKTKLNNRLATRKKLNDQFSSNIFDAAFQLNCMSSESSGEEDVEPIWPADMAQVREILRIRQPKWRSAQLQRLYQTLDERGEQERNSKPRRGLGRKERVQGPPREGNPLPPAGVSEWMVSKKWYRQACKASLGKLLQEVVKPNADGNEEGWQALSALDAWSDDEPSPPPPPPPPEEVPPQQEVPLQQEAPLRPEVPLHVPQVLPQTQIYEHLQAPQHIPDAYEEQQYYLQAQHLHHAQQWQDGIHGYMDISQIPPHLMHHYTGPTGFQGNPLS